MTKAGRKTDSVWQERFEQVRRFLGEHGSYPKATTDKSGAWCSNQRRLMGKGMLPKDKRSRLESLPGWVWNADFDGIWQERFKQLRDFVKKNKTYPSKYIGGDNGKLERWCNNQRQNKKNGKLSKDEMQQLESLPEWRWKNNFLEKRWQDSFERVVNFIKSNRRIPRKDVGGDENKLGQWCGSQRQYKKIGILSKKRIRMMESLPGWKWDIYNEQWMESFERVLSFVKKMAVYPEFNCEMGMWCGSQRKNKKIGILSKKRIRMMESLPGWKWEVLGERWQERFKQLRDFVKKNKIYPIRYIGGDEGKLGKWCGNQRQYKRNGKLVGERRVLLESLPGWKWKNDLDEAWKDNFEQVRDFIKKNKRYPKQEEGKLGIWCGTQRKAKRKGKMSGERVKMLESLSGWNWKPKGGWIKNK